MWKPLRIFSALLLVGFSASAHPNQEPTKAAPTAESKSSEAAKQANPIKPTPESIASGKKMYGYDCAMCHGKDGDGNGDVATSMKLKLLDYRDPASLKDITDGELFNIIKNGNGKMPPEGDRAKPDVVWDIINYIRSLGTKEAPPKENAGTE